jgi:hypothetical protein
MAVEVLAVRLDWQLVTGCVDRVNIRNEVSLAGHSEHNNLGFVRMELGIVVLQNKRAARKAVDVHCCIGLVQARCRHFKCLVPDASLHF